MTNWTPATGRVGVGVMVGVRVGRYSGEALRSTVLVGAGCRLASGSWVECQRSGGIPIRRGNRRWGEGGRPGGKVGGGVAAGGGGGWRSSQPGLEGLIENTGEVARWEGSGSGGGL